MERQIDFLKVEALLAQEGWSFSRLRLGEVRWATASKHFDSAGGGRTAVLYLQPSDQGGLYMYGNYESAGEDVLATHSRLIPEHKLCEFPDLLPAYLHEAEQRIDNSWGRRILRAS